MDIYTKKYTAKPRFKPHYNTSMMKYYETKDSYLSDIKKHGLEPYRGETSRPGPKPYVPSKEAHQFVESIKKRTDSKGNVHLSGNQQKYLRDRLSMKMPKNLNPNQGGFADA